MEIRDRLARWVAAGLISQEQATRIEQFERPAAPPPGARHRVPLIAEALGYLGGALALVAAIIVVQDFWADLETWGRLSLLGVATLALLVAGLWVRGSGNPAIERLASFLWALAVGGAAFWGGILAADTFDAGEEVTALVASGGALALAAPLWWLERRVLQQVAMFAAVLATLLAAGFNIRGFPEELAGLVVWGVGVTWAFLTWGGLLRPPRAGYALGSAAAVLGPQFAFVDDTAWPLLLGLATAGTLLAFSVAIRQLILLGFAAAGVFLYTPQAVFRWFGDTVGAPVALFLTGVLLLGAALVTARLLGRVTAPGEESPPAREEAMQP